jgi:two-component system cell cycle sensor histidine kinase/response regulator CckA
MTEEMSRPAPLDGLRRRAEDAAREVAVGMPENLDALSPEDGRKMLHELRVHQIELEMQNEELRRVQEELEASRARYFDLYDLAPVGYLSVSERGLIVEANLTFATMLGRSRSALLEQPLTRFVRPGDEDIYWVHRKPLFETGAPQVCELRMVLTDGSQFWARLEETVTREADGATVCRIALSDVTEHKRLENEGAKLQEQVNQAQKMETVGRLAGGVAHDLNNLLTPILGYGELLLSDFSPGDARRESAEEIVHAAERARDLVRQLLTFSRKQIGDFKLVDLNETVEGFKTLLRRAIRTDIAIESTSGPASCILGDTGQLEQAIMNLAVNAQDAMPGGGVLRIDTSVIEVDQAYAATCDGLPLGRYALLTIGDTGQGMDAETQTHLFEPFFTTKEKGRGTGLGLATVYGIVKQHGGRISVYSETGEGTTFKIYLPAVEGRASQIEPSQASVLDKDLRGVESILLVDDDLRVRDLTQAVLERLGYTVLLAEDGRKALAVLQAREGHQGDGRPVHLVLTDVIMPGMNGRDLVAKVSETYPGVRALLMSGYAEDAVASRDVLEARVNFLQKPFTVVALARKVRETLDA